MLFVDDVLELFVVPVLHAIFAHVFVHITFLRLALNAQIVRELALVTFLTDTLLEIDANNGLGIDALGNGLQDRLEEHLKFFLLLGLLFLLLGSGLVGVKQLQNGQ